MKSKNILLTAIIVLLFSILNANATNKDIELLRKRFTADALAQPANEGKVKQLMETISADGTWANINYIDTARTAFQHSVHLNNMIEMARAYKKAESGLKGNKELKKKLNLALNYWLANDFICENWWNNQIGTPMSMVTLLYIMDKELSKQQTEKMLAIAGRANMNAPGARPSGDRVKIASILAQTILWERDAQKLESVLKIIEGEIKFSGEESTAATAKGKTNPNYFAGGRGMQYDYSFHHRPDRVNNTLSYGLSYANAFVEWAVKVADTKYRFSEKSTKQLIDFYLDGICKQMIYGCITDPGVVNRDIARKRGSVIANTSIPENLIKITDYRKPELEEIIAARKGDLSNVPSFAKFFWQTEHFVFQRPSFYTSVRMFSSRNKNMEEPYNGEGLTNHYKADGANFISIKGDEYADIAPIFDFRKIPGATIMQATYMPPENEIQKSGIMDFVGGVTDGKYGAVSFDFKSPHDPVSAKKSWFFFDKEYICLGADINSSGQNEVYTTLNQCFLRGEVTVGTADNKIIEPAGEHVLNNAIWVHHNNTGYILCDKQDNVGLKNETTKGSWRKVNRQTTVSNDIIKGDIFSLWINHGANHSNSHYAYIVMPSASISEVESYTQNPTIEILSNTKDIQAVCNKNLGIAYAVFYKGGKIMINDICITSDTPAIIMVKYNGLKIEKMTVSDPSRKFLKLHISTNGSISTTDKRIRTIKGSANGTASLEIDLPQGEFAGESVVF